ncbi:DUF1905 domain-containing protein [Actinomadura barringtoniae]|uniref:DUF1905 domain-containing protein n=1 Tax=Actinomadura barringtoniae TaxID=1427535 RepID=A0A939PDQ9_9ACTN|nr:YdeI/OmpD-associated family protein [Actinomadura barringtoniae]MBO2448203.1 DUF1905 domain-containing protein [Actinomadura barringtoniae]
MAAVKFRAELEATGKTTTGFHVPESVVEGLGGGGHPKVVVTVNGFVFRTSIAKMGGRYLLGVSGERRKEADIAAGQVLDVEVELDTAPRTLEVPDDFAAALAAEPRAKEFWDTLSHSKQSWHVQQVTGAKKAETRVARIEKSVAMLSEGRAR